MAGEEVAPKSGSCCNGKLIIQMLLFGIWTAISVAFIVVGAIHKNGCAEEPFIPVYMIVAGAFSFAYWLLLPFECCFPTIRKIGGILVALFVFAWFIAGSVWVFRIYPIPNRRCHNGMYLFVFSILIIQWIFIALGLIASLFACLCCKNSCVAKMCSYCQTSLECCKCCQCFTCLNSCSCLESCNCLESCSCLKSLCCCCKNIQCSSCLNCSMCAQCCKCLQCCTAKV